MTRTPKKTKPFRKTAAAKPSQVGAIRRNAAAKNRSASAPKRKPIVRLGKSSPVAETSGKQAAVAFHGGIYLTPKGNVSLGIPAFWSFRQTNDDLEVESPSRSTSVIVTAFHRNHDAARLDARQYLDEFLSHASIKGRAAIEQSTALRAESRFRDLEGDRWRITVLTDGETLLLATLNSSLPERSPELRVGGEIVRSVRLRKGSQ